MGLLDLFSKDARAKGALQRNIARVSNKYAQSPDRFAAMEKLRDEGSDDALYGLCKRFSYKYDKSIEDEQEKEWAVHALVSKGEAAIPAVRRYAKEAETLSWALKILEQITAGEAGVKKMLEVVDEILAGAEPGYTRDPSRKLEMMGFLSEWHGAPPSEVAPRIAPYLKDFDQNVRFAAVDALAHQPDESARLPVLDAMLRPEEEARRIKSRAAEIVAEHGWTVTDRKEAVAALIASDLTQFGMHHDKLVRKAK